MMRGEGCVGVGPLALGRLLRGTTQFALIQRVKRGISEAGHEFKAGEGLGELGVVWVLNCQVEGAARKVGVGLGNGYAEPVVVLNAADDMAVGVVDRHGGFNRGENDGVGRSVVLDERREGLELCALEGNMGLHNVHGERVEYESGKDEQCDPEERLLVAGVEGGPKPIEHKAAGECHEGGEEHENEGVDGYIVAHERIPEQAGKQ